MKLIPSTHAADQHPLRVLRRSPCTTWNEPRDHRVRDTVDDDSREFERFARPHAAAALRLARTLVTNEADAQDVLQDSFLRAFRHFRGFSGESPRAWLLSIVRNVSFTLWRKQKRSEPDEPETELEAEPD